jgi:RNA polymerase sigma factor (TIGR02999 family)
MLISGTLPGAGMSENKTPSAPAGDGEAGPREPPEQLFASSYAELRRLADREIHRHAGSSISPTTLVHEAYLNMAGREDIRFEDRGRFLGYVARAMRGLLIDFARQRYQLKRGAQFDITHLRTQQGEEVADGSLTKLSDALDALAKLDPRLAEVVDLRYFCGFSFAEIGALRGASERTVQRDWEKARLLLYHEIELP